jgi:hypothetical protein
MSRVDVLITIEGTRLRETDKAVQFRIDSIRQEPIDPPKTEWFPFSQVRRSMTDKHTGEDTDRVSGVDYLVVTEWILQQKGLV